MQLLLKRQCNKQRFPTVSSISNTRQNEFSSSLAQWFHIPTRGLRLPTSMICWALEGNRPAWSDHTRWDLTGHWQAQRGCHCSRFFRLTFRNRSAGNPCQRRSLFGPKSEPCLPEKYSKKWDFTLEKLMANCGHCASNCCPEQISLTLYQVKRKSKWTTFTF